MRCPACCFENASGIKFCGEYGAPLKLKCSGCGFENAPTIKFCGECGKHEPFLHTERAELARLIGDKATREREFREAHWLFTEIGAPIRAAEVAKELGV